MFARALTVTAAATGGLLGVVAIVVTPGMAVGGAGFGALLGVLGWMWLREPVPGEPEVSQPTRCRAGLIVVGVVTFGWLALTGLVLLLGPASFPVLLALLLSAGAVGWWRGGDPLVAASRPALRSRLLRAAHRPDPPSRVRPRARPDPVVAAPPAAAPSSVPLPANLSTSQLCVAWQRTYFVLLSLPLDGARGDVVALRGRLLDEIESRDPDGFTRWLDTGARAGSDPGRYLAGDR